MGEVVGLNRKSEFLFLSQNSKNLNRFGVTLIGVGMGSLNVWFDEEGDFLEITSVRKKGFFKDLGNGIFERVDEDGNIIGFAVLNVKKRSKKEISVPFDVKFEEKTPA